MRTSALALCSLAIAAPAIAQPRAGLLEWQVSADGGATWSSSVTVRPGDVYRIRALASWTARAGAAEGEFPGMTVEQIDLIGANPSDSFGGLGSGDSAGRVGPQGGAAIWTLQAGSGASAGGLKVDNVTPGLPICLVAHQSAAAAEGDGDAALPSGSLVVFEMVAVAGTPKVLTISSPLSGSGSRPAGEENTTEVAPASVWIRRDMSADLNGDWLVDVADYLEYLNFFDRNDFRADLNHDNTIDFADYREFLDLFNAGPAVDWEVAPGGSSDDGPPPPSAIPVTVLPTFRPDSFVGIQTDCPGCNWPETSLFESSDLAGWTGSTGTHSTSGPSYSATGIVSGRHTVMTCPGYDPVLGGTILPLVREGKYSIRLGNSQSGAQAEKLSRTFTVTTQTATLQFAYAVVVQDPGHSPSEQPFFSYAVTASQSGLVTSVVKRASSTDPFFKVRSPGLLYHLWECVSIDLTPYMGQSVTIDFATGDCALAGHFGYAYIDGFCDSLLQPRFTMPNTVCGGLPIPVNGSASTGEISHFWSVELSDASGGRYPATERYAWFVGQEASTLDVRSFYQSLGGTILCNNYYRVKLAVSNGCIPWKSIDQLVYVTCPIIDAGPDRRICTVPGQTQYTTTIGTPGLPGYTYSWSPSTGVASPTSPSTSVTVSDPRPGTSTGPEVTYTLTVTDKSGCVATDTVKVKIVRPLQVQLEVDNPECCGQPGSHFYVVTPRVLSGDTPITHLWMPGGSTAPQLDVPASTLYAPITYTYTANNGCSTASASVTLEPRTGLIRELIYPNAIRPTSSIPANRKFFVAEYGTTLACGDHHAYNITEYRYWVYNRWGGVVAKLEGGCSWDFINCDIPLWDGRATETTTPPWPWSRRYGTHPGQYVKQDVYNWVLWYKNCNHQDWVRYNSKPIKLNVLY